SDLGSTPVGREYRLVSMPAVLKRPTLVFSPPPMTQSPPSGCAVMPRLPPTLPKAWLVLNSVSTPLVVILPILFDSRNHKLPSGPTVMSNGFLKVGPYSVTTPAGVILPIILAKGAKLPS